MNFRLKIVTDTTIYTSWANETNGAVTQAVQMARFNYPMATITVQHQASPPAPPAPTYSWGLKDDPNPTLNADLNLNGHALVGVLDGGQL
jgi:hypothetical protein